MNVQEMSRATIGRMPLYLRFLQEENQKGERYISSAVIAQNIPVSAVLVRKTWRWFHRSRESRGWDLKWCV